MELTKTQAFEKNQKYLFFMKPLFHFYYKRLVRKELSLTTLSKSDHILFIGAGALPLSAVYLKKYTEANITIIDNNNEMITCANNYLKSTNKDIKSLCIDGKNIDIDAYSVIFIANQVAPKSTVVNYILNHAKSNTKLFVRGVYTNKHKYLCLKCRHYLAKTKTTHLIHIT